MNDPILLVEDDSGVRTTIVTFLELEGFSVEPVSNTRDAAGIVGVRLFDQDLFQPRD